MKKKIIFFAFILLILCILGIALVLNYGYSDGYRTGKLVKLSKKGLLYKTYEGTLDLGSGDQLTWLFSLHKDEIGEELVKHTGKTVRLNYKEHLFKLFYATKYNVVGWEIVRQDNDYELLCRLVDIIKLDTDLVEKLRPIILANDRELIYEIRKCQKTDK